MLSSVIFWQSILSPKTFAWILDVCMWGLFSWKSTFMSGKHIVYRHLYSYSSVQVVVNA
jgi:lysosomal acid lipase/cholesteryl ester hydrolase